jgi:hypothetical protein
MGLLGSTAVMTVVASSVHRDVQGRQRGRWAEPERHAPSGRPKPPDNRRELLASLEQLRDAGVLTPAEFDAKQAAITGA